MTDEALSWLKGFAPRSKRMIRWKIAAHLPAVENRVGSCVFLFVCVCVCFEQTHQRAG